MDGKGEKIRFISIHSLRMEGDTTWRRIFCGFWNISIHSLRMEGDVLNCDYIIAQFAFQSTPSAWRETSLGGCARSIRKYFNPLPPHGGRPYVRFSTRRTGRISIHSLRMEGDVIPLFRTASIPYFNPLPPHGGRPELIVAKTLGYVISIHSLRMEGDSSHRSSPATPSLFQSTPSAWRET